ncbi:DUF2806 domain-containing protein [Aurantiacibacter xanthus]|uniref:DUF2806 domain-containing protein n=1 Tax=Aurantiacibacter xanthus TaxID=1784712 RepID=A0A3A1P7P3_9SPHN|nr:DUF2806 domain-containing protein [Aurantiacibacter xanthus]RIV89592.1 DUF2806 domain-containing protein [Aurantiacibacter xanthus]
MADKHDKLEVGIKAHLDTTEGAGSLSIETKYRFLAAIDRLLGGIFDLPATWIDVKSDNIKHEGELKRKLKEAAFAPVLSALEEGDHERARLLAFKAATDFREFEKTINLAAVAQKATLQLTDQSDDSDDSDTGSIKDEWLSRFQHYSSTASSEEMRALWARVLAGEARTPGSFSAASLRFIFDLDSGLAEVCERFAKRILQGAILLADVDNSGPSLTEAMALQAAGALTGVGSTLTRTWTPNERNEVLVVAKEFALQAKVVGPAPLQLESWFVTNVGSEIFSLLPQPDERELLLDAGRALTDQHKQRLEWVKVLRLGEVVVPGTRPVLAEEVVFRK